MSGERAAPVEAPPHSDDQHRAGYRSDCLACVWNDRRIGRPPETLRRAMSEHGWFVANILDASWVESSEWVPVVREAAVQGPAELREALEIIAAAPEHAPDAIGVTARNIARAALGREADVR